MGCVGRSVIQVGQMSIFVSHSSEDGEFCSTFVSALREARSDVWYDEDNLGTGVLRTEIMRELSNRPTFIVVLSPAALKSQWVQDECEWAYNLLRREPQRIFLPVTAQAYDPRDFNTLLYLEGMKRVEAAGNRPYHMPEAVERTRRLLSLSTGDEVATIATVPEEKVEDLIARGKALNAQQQESRALQFLDRACHMAPNNVDAWVNLGYTFNRLRRFDEALSASERALLLEPRSPAAWTRKGAALFNLQRYPEALAACDEALTFDQRYPDAWSIKGMVLYAQGHHDEAVAANQSAVALDPNYVDAWIRLADELLQIGRFEEAIAAFDQALSLGADVVACRHGKVTALLQLGRTEEALKLVTQQGFPLMPTAALAAFSVYELDRHLGKKDRG